MVAPRFLSMQPSIILNFILSVFPSICVVASVIVDHKLFSAYMVFLLLCHSDNCVGLLYVLASNEQMILMLAAA